MEVRWWTPRATAAWPDGGRSADVCVWDGSVGFRVWGLGFRVSVLGFRVLILRVEFGATSAVLLGEGFAEETTIICRFGRLRTSIP